MGFFDELKKLTHQNQNDEEEETYEEEDYSEEEYVPQEPKRTREISRSDFDRRNNKVVNIHTTTQLQVVLVKPSKYTEARDIADHLKFKRTVVLNLENTDPEEGKRLLDFLSGVAYGSGGKLKKVSLATYIVTTNHVDIQGDLLDELENNGLIYN